MNTIGHQEMVPFEKGGSSYSLIHLLRQVSGGAPFHDVLIIGAGSGNDLDHARANNSALSRTLCISSTASASRKNALSMVI